MKTLKNENTRGCYHKPEATVAEISMVTDVLILQSPQNNLPKDDNEENQFAKVRNAGGSLYDDYGDNTPSPMSGEWDN